MQIPWDKKLCNNFFPWNWRKEHFLQLFLYIFPSNWKKKLSFADLHERLTIWRKNLQIVQSFFSRGMLQSFFAKVFVPWEKKLCKKSIWRKKLRLQRKFLLNSLFSKPYRNSKFVALTKFLSTTYKTVDCGRYVHTYVCTGVNFLWKIYKSTYLYSDP